MILFVVTIVHDRGMFTFYCGCVDVRFVITNIQFVFFFTAGCHVHVDADDVLVVMFFSNRMTSECSNEIRSQSVNRFFSLFANIRSLSLSLSRRMNQWLKECLILPPPMECISSFSLSLSLCLLFRLHCCAHACALFNWWQSLRRKMRMCIQISDYQRTCSLLVNRTCKGRDLLLRLSDFIRTDTAVALVQSADDK